VSDDACVGLHHEWESRGSAVRTFYQVLVWVRTSRCGNASARLLKAAGAFIINHTQAAKPPINVACISSHE
jgi:hypothetical protein